MFLLCKICFRNKIDRQKFDMKVFQVEHESANDYYHNHLKDGKSFTHLVGCDKFSCWVYYNGNDIDPVKELRILNSL